MRAALGLASSGLVRVLFERALDRVPQLVVEVESQSGNDPLSCCTLGRVCDVSAGGNEACDMTGPAVASFCRTHL